MNVLHFSVSTGGKEFDLATLFATLFFQLPYSSSAVITLHATTKLHLSTREYYFTNLFNISF